MFYWAASAAWYPIVISVLADFNGKMMDTLITAPQLLNSSASAA